MKSLHLLAWVALLTIIGIAGATATYLAVGPITGPSRVKIPEIHGACKYQALAVLR